MNHEYAVWGLLALAMASALVSGIFLAFSDVVMPSLRAARPVAGSEAMQMINRQVYRSVFIVLLVGLIPISVAVAVWALVWTDTAAGPWLVAAGVLYSCGVFGTSAIGNIPKNRILESMPLAGVAAQAYWPDYVRGWLPWNHLRTVSSMGTAACYMVAAVLLAQAG